MAGLYASQHPDRVESLFMISPSGTGEVPDDKLDPY
jgi:pimeloyl-ACP methyl ester carboxylesterase